MKTYLSSLVKQLKNFSLTLDKISILIDKPWAFIDGEQEIQKLIFKKNKELILSSNGKVTIGKWDYFPEAHSILIDRNTDIILCNEAFIEEGIMILKRDGTNDEYFILTNENLVPDLDPVRYLSKLRDKKLCITRRELENGPILEIQLNNGNYLAQNIGPHQNVFMDGEKVGDGMYFLKGRKQIFSIVNSRIDSILTQKLYLTKDKINLVVYQHDFNVSNSGDKVYIEDMPAPDGKYRIGLFKSIYVMDGLITSPAEMPLTSTYRVHADKVKRNMLRLNYFLFILILILIMILLQPLRIVSPEDGLTVVVGNKTNPPEFSERKKPSTYNRNSERFYKLPVDEQSLFYGNANDTMQNGKLQLKMKDGMTINFYYNLKYKINDPVKFANYYLLFKESEFPSSFNNSLSRSLQTEAEIASNSVENISGSKLNLSFMNSGDILNNLSGFKDSVEANLNEAMVDKGVEITDLKLEKIGSFIWQPVLPKSNPKKNTGETVTINSILNESDKKTNVKSNQNVLKKTVNTSSDYCDNISVIYSEDEIIINNKNNFTIDKVTISIRYRPDENSRDLLGNKSTLGDLEEKSWLEIQPGKSTVIISSGFRKIKIAYFNSAEDEIHGDCPKE